jgi:DNA polymerase-3 subunit alpha (Gram-positive type)
VEDADKYDDAIPLIVSWYKSLKKECEVDKVVFVAHNAPFDIKFFNHASQLVLGEDMITEFIDTVSLARELYPFWRNHKLDTCAKKFGVVNDNHHRAENDTIVLMNIGKRLITEALETNLNPLNFITKKNLHYKNN